MTETTTLSEFSSSQERGSVCLPCQQGNLFRLSVPEGMTCPVAICAKVGGKSTPTLPENQGYMLPNTLPGTSGALELEIAGKTHPIFPDIQAAGRPVTPQEVRSHIIMQPLPPVSPRPEWLDRPRPMVPIGQNSSARLAGQMGSIPQGHEMNALDVISEENWIRAGRPQTESGEILPTPPSDPVVLVAEPPAHIGAPPAAGDYDVSTMTEDEARWFAEAIHWITSDLQGDIVRSGADSVYSWQSMLNEGNNRRFLREMTDSKLMLRAGKRGLLLVLKEGNWSKEMLWHRRLTKYGSRGMSNLKVSSMNVAVKSMGQNVADNVWGLGSRTGALGVVFAVSFDIAEYLSSDGERFLSDLLVSIGFTLAGAVLSAVVGTILASAALTAASAIGLSMAPIIIAGTGIGLVVAAGFAIGRIVSAIGLKEAVQEFFRDLDWYEDVYKGGMTDEEISQGMRIAP